MDIERSRETSTKEGFQQVASIEGPGMYRFASNPNLEFRYYGGSNYHDSLGGDRPYFEHEIPHHFRKRFPHIWSIQFHPATLYDGKYAPARLEYSSEWDYNHRGFIGLDGEIYDISSGGRSSNGYGDWQFAMKDIGNLSIVENKLQIAEPENRNGGIKLYLSGTAPHYHRDTGKSWRGWVEVEGERSGVLVQTAIEYINNVKTASNIPLWKAL